MLERMGKSGIELILFATIVLFFAVLLAGNISAAWVNMSDGFSISVAGANTPSGITTNGSDFWIIDPTDDFVYHFDKNGINQTDGFKILAAGSTAGTGITTNNSDFWVLDNTDDFVYHFDKNGNNITDGFSVSAAGALLAVEIETNNSDFWVAENSDGFVYHFNRTGGNYTSASTSSINAIGEPGFSTSAVGVDAPLGITTNNSDFWVSDALSDANNGFVYHFDRNGNNITDGFSISAADLTSPSGITTNVTIGGTPTDFWIVDGTELFVYHFSQLQLSINFVNPQTNNTNASNANLNINYSFSNNSKINSIWYSNDTYSVNLSLGSGGTYFNMTNITWSEGKHNLTIYVNDSANNLNFSTISFTTDTIAPTISFVCSPSSINTGDTITCSCSSSDSISGVQTTAYTENPSTTNTGTFSQTCSVTDFAGNSGTAEARYTVESSSSSGIGGDSSNGDSGTKVVEPIAEITNLITSISPEQTATISNLNSEKTFISEIQIDVKEQVQNIKMDIAAYDEKPEDTVGKPEGTTYKYLKIVAENLNTNLEKATVIFQLEKSKVNESFDKENIALFKFNETSSEWMELETNFTNDDDKYYYYGAELHSFSYFAIAEKAKNAVEILTEKITESYDAASKHFLSLILWWIVYSIIIVLIMIVSVLLVDFFIKNYEFASKNISAFVIYWLGFSILIVASMIFIVVPANFLIKNHEILSYTFFGLVFLWLILSILTISAIIIILLIVRFYSGDGKG